MTSKHCHVDAGPDREEIMTKEALQYCLNALRGSDIETVELTGGAPEMNPHFRWFVDEVHNLGKDVISIKCLKLKPAMAPRSIFATGMKKC